MTPCLEPRQRDVDAVEPLLLHRRRVEPEHQHDLSHNTLHIAYCICVALHCIALSCIALRRNALHCVALHCIAYCIALRRVALHCTVHCMTARSIALHCIVSRVVQRRDRSRMRRRRRRMRHTTAISHHLYESIGFSRCGAPRRRPPRARAPRRSRWRRRRSRSRPRRARCASVVRGDDTTVTPPRW